MIKQWDRDVLCLPTRKSNGVISFPSGKYRTYLANCGLIGKFHMTSDMDEEDVAREIRSIFKGPMKGKADFRFHYLQATGGGTKSLTVPAQVSLSSGRLFKFLACLGSQEHMAGASLLNGGPAPNFFANIVANYILFGIERVKVKLGDVVTVNPNMHGKLEKVTSTLNIL